MQWPMWRDSNATCPTNFIAESIISFTDPETIPIFSQWIDDNFLNLKEVVEKNTEHSKLLRIEQYQIRH